MNINIKELKVPATARNGRIYTGGNISNTSTSTSSSGGSGDKNYIHIQGIPSATWTIIHNLGKYPSVTVIDTAGTEIEGQVTHVDNNNLIIEFSASFAGTATLN